MVFKDTQTLSGLYEGITKKAEPSKDQLIEQAPILSNTALSKDQDMLLEAYNVITNKGAKEVYCKYAAKGCDCDGCEECKDNQEPIEEAKKKDKPDYMDVDKDGDKKESMKKALNDKKKHQMKEQYSSFKNLYDRVISEKKREYDLKGAFHDESESNPQLKKDREKLEKMRKERSKTKPYSLKKEGLSFKSLYNSVMIESKQEVVCGTKINPSFQYNCVMKDGTKKVLKGESVLGLRDKLKTVSKAG